MIFEPFDQCCSVYFLSRHDLTFFNKILKLRVVLLSTQANFDISVKILFLLSSKEICWEKLEIIPSARSNGSTEGSNVAGEFIKPGKLLTLLLIA